MNVLDNGSVLDFFHLEIAQPLTICFNSNGSVKKDGKCVIGRGLDKDLSTQIKELPLLLGAKVSGKGNNIPHVIWNKGFKTIVNLPTKKAWVFIKDLSQVKSYWKPEVSVNRLIQGWMLRPEVSFIEESLIKLVNLVDMWGMKTIVMQRPGCEDEGLCWNTEVLPLCEKYLDGRFNII